MNPPVSQTRWILRIVGLAIGVVVGLTIANVLTAMGGRKDAGSILVTLGLTIGGIGNVLGPHISWRIIRDVKRNIRDASSVDIVAIGVGLAFGALVSAPLALPLSYLPDPLGRFLPIAAAVAACTLSVSVALIRKRDLIAPWLKPRSPKTAAALAAETVSADPDPAPAPTLLLDTNVIIDGRLPEIVRTGFLSGRLGVPRFVLDELQRIADSEDPLRRARGRRGLESLNDLRREFPQAVDVLDDVVPEEREVDAKLIRLAKSRGSAILTNDFNLNRVAQVQNVSVLNLNELTNALRPSVLPGEELSLRLVQEGREAGQGIGYLDDGTMVVVDGGRALVGNLTAVVVTRLLQTGAGRMVFATPKHAAS
ncbi:MAG: PIN/TRAM domain-containing protein [Thermomicrobiales bacterium]